MALNVDNYREFTRSLSKNRDKNFKEDLLKLTSLLDANKKIKIIEITLRESHSLENAIELKKRFPSLIIERYSAKESTLAPCMSRNPFTQKLMEPAIYTFCIHRVEWLGEII